jgi:hypothetical protein
MTNSYDQTPAPIGWLERLDKRFMDHLEAEKEEWSKIHKEIAAMATKMEMLQKNSDEYHKILMEVSDAMHELRGAYMSIKVFAALAAAATAVATWIGLT